jgi:hypothetical protein
VDLLDPIDTLVQRTINRRRNSERTSDNGAKTHKETRECLVTDLAIDNLHRGNVLISVNFLVRLLNVG